MPELCVSCCSVASQGFSPEEVLGVSGKVLMSLVVAPPQVFGGSSCGVSSFMISLLEKWQILFLEMTGKPWRFSTAGSQGLVWLLHSSSAHCEKKQLKKHCPLDTVVLATIPKGAQNPFETLKFSSPWCVDDGHSQDKLFHPAGLSGELGEVQAVWDWGIC